MNVVARVLPSPPVTPPTQLSELQLQELALLPANQPPLAEGKRYHFFICHHQGSGGDQSHLLCRTARGPRVPGVARQQSVSQSADHRNLHGMVWRQACVPQSAC